MPWVCGRWRRRRFHAMTFSYVAAVDGRSAWDVPSFGVPWKQSSCWCPAVKDLLLELQRDKKISFKQTPNTPTFQEVQFSTGTLQLLLILHNPSCILPFKENTLVMAWQSTCKERKKVLFSWFFVITLRKCTVPLLPLLSCRNPLNTLHILQKLTSPLPFSCWEFVVAW